MPSKYLHMAYTPNVVGIFLSGTYLAIPYEVQIEVGNILKCVCRCNEYLPAWHNTKLI